MVKSKQYIDISEALPPKGVNLIVITDDNKQYKVIRRYTNDDRVLFDLFNFDFAIDIKVVKWKLC